MQIGYYHKSNIGKSRVLYWSGNILPKGFWMVGRDMESKMMALAVYMHWYAEIVNAGLQPSQRHYLA